MHSSGDEHLEVLYFLTNIIMPLIDNPVQFWGWKYAFIFLGQILESWVAGCMICVCLTFKEIGGLFFPHWLYSFVFLPSVYVSCSCSLCWPTLGMVSLFILFTFTLVGSHGIL